MLGVVGSVLGLLGLIAGVGAWLRPLPTAESSAPVYSEEQVADAKKAVCEAYGEVSRAITATTSRDRGDDPTTKLVVAVNVRLALYAGGDYLRGSLSASPATPDELSDSVLGLAQAYQQVAIKQLGEAPRDDLDALADSAKSYASQIDKACQ